jgi:hypothetical protein
MCKLSLKDIKFKKKKFIFFIFKMSFLKNNIFINLSLNNKFIRYKSFGYLNPKGIDINILNSFNYYFINSKFYLNYSLFIFKISGIKKYIKFFLRDTIINFLRIINFKKGTLYFIENTFLSFNGCKKIKIKRNKKKKIY